MYILFALLVALLMYGLAYAVLRIIGRREQFGSLSTVSVVAFVALLVMFNLVSRAIGVDLGPFHAVAYSIPDDYIARGLAGVVALTVYALACLAPVLGLGAALRQQHSA